jgi:hypothetical protein
MSCTELFKLKKWINSFSCFQNEHSLVFATLSMTCCLRQIRGKKRTFVSYTRMYLNNWQHCEILRFCLMIVTWAQSLEHRHKWIVKLCCYLYVLNVSYWRHHIHRSLREWRIRKFFQNLLFNFTAPFRVHRCICGS